MPRIVIDEGEYAGASALFAGLFAQAADAVFEHEGIGADADAVEIGVRFAEADEIRRFNHDYRGKDAVTDVLSFPMFESVHELAETLRERGEDEDFVDAELLLGDVVICGEKARAQAQDYGHGEEREIAYLFTHSLLHLLGYDHEDAAAREAMRTVEEGVMSRIGLPR